MASGNVIYGRSYSFENVTQIKEIKEIKTLNLLRFSHLKGTESFPMKAYSPLKIHESSREKSANNRFITTATILWTRFHATFLSVN